MNITAKRIDNELNHQAYMDVFEDNGPLHIDNEDYMHCYRFWIGVAGRRDFLGDEYE